MAAMNRLLRLGAILTAPVLITGCGGGGSASGPVGAGRSVSVFATDSPREDFDHVWTTIHRIEVIDASGHSQAVMDDAVGETIDLKTLRDSQGQRFALLTSARVGSAPLAGVRVTIGKTLTLVPRGSSAGASMPVADDVPRDGAGNAQISCSLSSAPSAGGDHVIIDFDLSSFTVSGGKVRPVVKEGSDAGMGDALRHDHSRFDGVVSNLAGTPPNVTFTLNLGSGASVPVRADANTVLLGEHGQAAPALANGARVRVEGVFDAAANVLAATSIQIEPNPETENEAEVTGAPSSINAGAGTFSVTIDRAHGLLPLAATVQVTTGANTVFRAGGSILTVADFFAALPQAAKVEVSGSFDAASNTLSASLVRIEDESEHEGHGGHDDQGSGGNGGNTGGNGGNTGGHGGNSGGDDHGGHHDGDG